MTYKSECFHCDKVYMEQHKKLDYTDLQHIVLAKYSPGFGIPQFLLGLISVLVNASDKNMNIVEKNICPNS